MIVANELSISIREAKVEDLENINFYWRSEIEMALAIDLDPVMEIQEQRYKKAFEPKFNEVTDIFKIWVAELDGKIVGWQYLLPFENNPALHEVTAEVSTYVDPEHKVMGVGKELLKNMERHVLGTPLQYVVGYVSEGNEAMNSFAMELGFEKVGTFPPPKKKPFWHPGVMYVYVVPGDK